MNFAAYSPQDLNWNLDFAPRTLWSSFMPVMGIVFEGVLSAISGFDQKTKEKVNVLTLEGTPIEVCHRIYQNLAPIEEVRLTSVLKIKTPYDFLLKIPKELQDYFDDRTVALKVLRPLEHLNEWTNEITRAFISLKPTASQVREILDLLCDIKFQGKSWSASEPLSGDAHKWILTLRKLRFPLSWDSDEKASRAISSLPWPRGVQAKWERQGDQAGVLIQAKVNSFREWTSLKESFGKLELEEGIWKT